MLTGTDSQQNEGESLESEGDRLRMVEDWRHRFIMRDGTVFEGGGEEAEQALRDARDAGRPLDEYMAIEARRFYGATGMRIASHAPEAFIRASADAGMLRIVR